jgi:hypothetical protein
MAGGREKVTKQAAWLTTSKQKAVIARNVYAVLLQRERRAWPPLIKMDAAVKAKVEKLFSPRLARRISAVRF